VCTIDDPGICAHPIHLQFYGYNDLYLEILKRKAGGLAAVLGPGLRAMARRLFVVFGYLHSSVSSSLRVSLSEEGGGTLFVEGVPNPLAAPIARAAGRTLLRNHRYFRAIPMLFQLRPDLPGGGYHTGGAFPMRHIPGPLETDRWGSLSQLSGVHIVDASVLPTVPASPIAFVVMANAHRIASECPVPDDD
jgi:hypothetical protein